ncbi:uncharacterized protein LOC110739905 [Chenopodium quinoa]|uniref:uncharacterized protein LOC110739905 n=1 Tax=Chenopodium quinoa TaxID=63459 RepID=UPI000B7885EE|nr:uncharacterized protein LOC110739905 [Chenopodium quinoa]
MEIKDWVSYEKPLAMKGPAKYRDKYKYCHFHEYIGHDINATASRGYWNKLAAKGLLKFYVLKSKVTLQTDPKQLSKKAAKAGSGSDTDQDMICTGGFASGGPTIRGTKDHVRKMVNSVDEGQTSANTFLQFVISKKDRGKVCRSHEDSIVIEFKVGNQKVGRILIDTGISSDIISWQCLSKLRYNLDSMHKVSSSLVGFGGGVVYLVGLIDLPFRLGEKGEGRHMVVRFLVDEEMTAYNLILGRPTLNESKAVIIHSLILLKFEKDDGSFVSLNGDQKTA